MINFVKVLRKNLVNLDAPSKTYAVSQSRGTMDMDALSAHMANHNTPFSRGAIKGVLEDFVDCVRELILDGWIIDMGNLGTFNVVLESNGVCESVADEDTGEKPVFTYANIKAVNCLYTPGKSFENMIEDAQFHEVQARVAQSKALQNKAKALADGTYKNATV